MPSKAKKKQAQSHRRKGGGAKATAHVTSPNREQLSLTQMYTEIVAEVANSVNTFHKQAELLMSLGAKEGVSGIKAK